MAEDDSAAFSDDRKIATSKYSGRIRKKVTAEWGEAATLTLITTVETHHLLWNPASEDYKSRALRNKVWEEMATQWFNGEFDADELQAKWTNLRVQFKFYHGRAMKAKLGQGVQGHVTWKFYGPMMFLAAVKKEPAEEAETIHEPDTEHESSSSSIAMPTVKHKRKSSEFSDNLNIMAPEIVQSVPQLMDGGTDSFQTFGNFIASELRKIPDPAVANRVQRSLTRNLLDLLDAVDSDPLQFKKRRTYQ